MKEDDMKIGQITSSNSHVDYVTEIYDESTREEPPEHEDYEFGQFVYVSGEVGGKTRVFVGVIYNTMLVDPEQGSTGPRLSSPEDQEIFQPSYVDEKQVLAGIAMLGYMTLEDGEIVEKNHGMPKWTLEIGDEVRKLGNDDFVEFHEIEGEIKMEYFSRVQKVAGEFGVELLETVIEKLKEERPEEEKTLEVVRKNLEWKSRMEEM